MNFASIAIGRNISAAFGVLQSSLLCSSWNFRTWCARVSIRSKLKVQKSHAKTTAQTRLRWFDSWISSRKVLPQFRQTGSICLCESSVPDWSRPGKLRPGREASRWVKGHQSTVTLPYLLLWWIPTLPCIGLDGSQPSVVYDYVT